MDPDAGRVPFGKYATAWINDQVLKPRTEELYRGLLKNHLSAAFGSVDLGDIRESDIRRWRKERLSTGPQQSRPFGPVTVAKAYRLLHAVMNTAADDGIIRRNPCRIKGAGLEDSRERPVISAKHCSNCSTRCRRDTGRWFFSPRSPVCASVSWPDCDAANWT